MQVRAGQAVSVALRVASLGSERHDSRLSRLFVFLRKYSVVCLLFCKRGEGQQGHRGSTSLGNEMVEWQGAQDPRSELAS